MRTALPEALSFVHVLGWQRWAMRTISSSGLSVPVISAVRTSMKPS
jgi:hypothetical protein